MKRLLIFCLLYTIPLLLLAQTKDTILYYRSGEKLAEGKLKKGLKHGTWISYYKSGVKRKVEFFQKGINGGPEYTYSGKEFVFYGNGSIKEEYTYVKGKLDGIQKHYYSNGRLKKELTCAHGWYYNQVREYYPDSNHTLKSVIHYHWNIDTSKLTQKMAQAFPMKADSLYGIKNPLIKTSDWQYYYPSGMLKTEGGFEKAAYTKDKKDHWWEQQYEDNKIKTKRAQGSVDYKEDTSKLLFTGKDFVYYEAHTVKEERNWVNGKLEGIQKHFYVSGALKKEIPCLNGLFHGILKEYYEDGPVYSEIQYAHGKAITPKKTYYPNGILRSEGPMKDGCIRLYDTLGNRIQPRWQPNQYSGMIDDKPVIYLYPEKETAVEISLQYNGKFMFTYPEYKNGWKVKAFPDGKIVNEEDHQEYSYLFWEGENYNDYLNSIDLTTGTVVKGADTQKFLRKTLSDIGLTPKEYNEFLVYWLPKMIHQKYNYIYFLTGEEYDKVAGITVDPKPDAAMRIFMVFQPLEYEIDLTPQTFTPFKRKGFTLIEWGGTQTNSLIRF